jgi:hypothetical protein
MFIPADPVNVPLGPLNKGMFRNLSPEDIPKGGLYTASNYIITENGPKKRPAYVNYAGGSQWASVDQPLIDVVPLWQTDGTQLATLLGRRYIYTVSGYSFTGHYWDHSTGTISVGGTAVTGTSSNWSTGRSLQANDRMLLISGSVLESVAIATVDSSTAITLAAAPTVGVYSTGSSYTIRRTLTIDDEVLLDSTVADDKVIITDYDREPYSFDGTTFTVYDADITYKCGCLHHFASRLWIGNTIESSTYYKQRLRWTSATDRTSFAAADYLDLPYSAGALRRILGMGNLLILYFDDAIYFGRPTNLADLPYAFTRIETGGIGLIGPKAVTPFLDGHFFVGQDNIYLLTNRGMQPIGTPIVKDSVKDCSNFFGVYAAVDSENDRVLFGFPEDGDTIAKIWSYSYKNKAWSYDDIPCSFLAAPRLEEGLTWTDLGSYLTTAGYTATWTDLGTVFGTWSDIGVEGVSRVVFLGKDGYVRKYTKDGSQDLTTTSITALIETGDVDLDRPDLDKTALRLSVKLEERPSSDLSFTVTGSTDGGNSWKALGTLTIASDKREGKLTFKLTGSVIRIRLTSTSNVSPYTISEIVLRVRPRGLEVNFE